MKRLYRKLKNGPINYFSDLFIVAMVLLWIFDNVYQSVVASAVTLSSVYISIKTGVACYDTSMWSSIGTNVALPLSCGGALWMIKNGVQHAIANNKGKECPSDFPAVEAEGEDAGKEQEIENLEDEEEEDQ